LVEQHLPVGLAERRQHAANRLPFDDRKTGFGEPDIAAEHDHREHQRGDHEQPAHDPAVDVRPRALLAERSGKNKVVGADHDLAR
jgi:hypothetical protein